MTSRMDRADQLTTVADWGIFTFLGLSLFSPYGRSLATLSLWMNINRILSDFTLDVGGFLAVMKDTGTVLSGIACWKLIAQTVAQGHSTSIAPQADSTRSAFIFSTSSSLQ